jgi:uncharacterized protein YaaN involved in tellurite resistance
LNATSEATSTPTDERRASRRAANKAARKRLRGRAITAIDPNTKRTAQRVLVASLEGIERMADRTRKQKRRKAKALDKYVDRVAARGVTLVSRSIAR